MSRPGFVFVVSLLGLLGLLAALLLLGPLLEGRVLPGVRLWQTDVGGLKPEELAVRAQQAAALEVPRIIFAGPEGRKWSYAPRDLGLTINVDETVTRSLRPGHDQDSWGLPLVRLGLMREGAVVSPVLVWERQQAQQVLESLAMQVDEEPVSARVYLEGTEVRLESSRVGRYVDMPATLLALEAVLRSPEPAELPLVVQPLTPEVTDVEAAQALSVAHTILEAPLRLLLSEPQEGDGGPWTLQPEVLARMLVISLGEGGRVQVELEEGALAEFLAPIAAALQREPVDARFRFDVSTGELVALTESRTGRALDVAASVARINEQVRVGQHMVPLVLEEVAPAYPDTSTAADLGIVEVVAVGESYFSGSSSARDHNIRLGASKFDGVIVAPGETFSFNEHLGEVTPDEGYDESYVIIGNRTVPGVGGGICQVATTAFRAAYYGGYRIIERWPHAYRVGYYELGGYGPGFDATIYSPIVDFRFVNDTEHHLLIHTEVDSGRARLRFVFYGTDDGRTVEQIGPEWGAPVPAGPPIYEYDATLAPGAVTRLEGAHDGLTAVLERRVHDSGGELLYHDRFESRFVPWSARYRFGPGFQPPADAEVIGLPAGD